MLSDVKNYYGLARDFGQAQRTATKADPTGLQCEGLGVKLRAVARP